VCQGGSGLSEWRRPQADPTCCVQLTASTAHLRGLIHLHQGANELAKEAFIEALSRDVKCFESFEMLVSGEMMTHDEGE
jgi:anaphase-promoting complex subunit 6